MTPTDKPAPDVRDGLKAMEDLRRSWFCSGADCTEYDHGRDEGLEIAIRAFCRAEGIAREEGQEVSVIGRASVSIASAPSQPSADGVVTIPAGMRPWAGGDSAPEDWDSRSVWLRHGGHGEGRSWHHSKADAEQDIIAYTRRPSAETGEVDREAAIDALEAKLSPMFKGNMARNLAAELADTVLAALAPGAAK